MDPNRRIFLNIVATYGRSLYARTIVGYRVKSSHRVQVKDGYDLALKVIKSAKKSARQLNNSLSERVLTILEERDTNKNVMQMVVFNDCRGFAA